MRHFDAWLLRDPYSIFHYYSTGRRWQESVRDMIKQRQICAPSIDLPLSLDTPLLSPSTPVDPFSRPISPQADSPLLTKLPPEIRLMIYEYAFGDSVVHLVQVKDKIRHVRCHNTTSSLDSHRRCCPVTPARWRLQQDSTTPSAEITASMLYPHTHARLPSTLSNTPAALLRTCRTIYAEAASLLYTSSVFDVDDLHTFIAFSLTISPEHLRTIKRLTVQWSPVWQPMAGEEHKSSIYSHTHNDQLWALFWTRVAALTGLEELNLTLDLGRFSGSPATGIIGGKRLRLSIDEPWVSPLFAVRGLRAFELGITARCDAYAKRVLENDLVKDAAALRDHLKDIICSPVTSTPAFLLQTSQVPELLLLKRPCGQWFLETEESPERKIRPRLAITAA